MSCKLPLVLDSMILRFSTDVGIVNGRECNCECRCPTHVSTVVLVRVIHFPSRCGEDMFRSLVP
ncbi:MAG: DUF4210 domain-containing protein [Proteobacteria bacterium]|nr:MAG: DUF4210 domain-containing protein [Pseudomonadota bacterium]